MKWTIIRCLSFISALVMFGTFIHCRLESGRTETTGLSYASATLVTTNQKALSPSIEILGVARKFRVYPLVGKVCPDVTFRDVGYGGTDLQAYIGKMIDGGSNTEPEVVLCATMPSMDHSYSPNTGEREYYVWAREMKIHKADGSTMSIWITFHM